MPDSCKPVYCQKFDKKTKTKKTLRCFFLFFYTNIYCIPAQRMEMELKKDRKKFIWA